MEKGLHYHINAMDIPKSVLEYDIALAEKWYRLLERKSVCLCIQERNIVRDNKGIEIELEEQIMNSVWLDDGRYVMVMLFLREDDTHLRVVDHFGNRTRSVVRVDLPHDLAKRIHERISSIVID